MTRTRAGRRRRGATSPLRTTRGGSRGCSGAAADTAARVREHARAASISVRGAGPSMPRMKKIARARRVRSADALRSRESQAFRRRLLGLVRRTTSLAVAPDARSLRDPGLRDHAPADAGGAGRSYWTRFPRALSDASRIWRPRPPTRARFVAGLGYYARARNLHAAASGRARPRRRASRRSRRAPAAARHRRYTAAAVASIAFGADVGTVDTNVAARPRAGVPHSRRRRARGRQSAHLGPRERARSRGRAATGTRRSWISRTSARARPAAVRVGETVCYAR
jgi:hypothetical protein